MTTKQIDKFTGRKVKVTLNDNTSTIALLFRTPRQSRLTGELFDSNGKGFKIGMLYCSDVKSIEEVK